MKTSILYFIPVLLLISCDSHISRNLDTIEETTKLQSEITYHKSHEPKKANAPFSDVVQVGDTYYLAGQVGMNHTTRTLVEGGIEAETKQAIENIKAVLNHHSLKLENVVKATVILKDINDFSVFNEIYKAYFPQKPARTTFAASGLAVGASIEIEVIAVR